MEKRKLNIPNYSIKGPISQRNIFGVVKEFKFIKIKHIYFMSFALCE